jgi:L-methionine (R)-S-oxide reductase
MDITTRIDALARERRWADLLQLVVNHLAADSGTLHLMETDGQLHLAASTGIPPVVADTVRTVPVGKGMAGLAVERRRPVDACNIQTDASGDVRPGARATGLQGSIVVPLLDGDTPCGALGVANRAERTFTDDEQRALLGLGRAIAAAVGAR